MLWARHAGEDVPGSDKMRSKVGKWMGWARNDLELSILGMFCRFGSADDSLPVAVPVWRKFV